VKSKRPRRRAADDPKRLESQRPTPGLLAQRSLALDPSAELPRVYLRSTTFRPFVYRKMIERADRHAAAGDLVVAIAPDGQLFGHALYNPRSEIVLRMLTLGESPPDEAFWHDRLAQAIGLRRDLLKLDDATNAYRLVHAEADGLSGLVVDRFGDVLSAEAFSLGIFQRAEAILQHLAGLCGASHWICSVDAHIHGQEGFLADAIVSPGCPRQVIVTEHGTRFKVRFEGHKTGFFCDQRENRRRLADFCQGRRVLDLCSYTGGFAVQAMRLGRAAEVTAVDLDEQALALARENAQLNQARIHFVHADAFGYMRDMISLGRQYDVVVLDPPKLIRSRRELEEGTRKHFDLNRLAIQLVRPGGLLLTCSCSGLLSEVEFLKLIYAAARRAGPRGDSTLSGSGAATGADAASSKPVATGRSVQLLAKTGAAADHPIAPNSPETEYLRAAWLRVV
jgi:23S rRNA (cytosine1962-C5)-methyltransferase